MRSRPTTRGLALAAALFFLASPSPGEPTAEAAPVDFSERRDRALRLLRAGEAAEAAALFSGLLDKHPTDVQSIEGRVRALLALQSWEQGLAEARRFRQRLPTEPRVLAVLSEALYRAGRLEEIETVLAPLKQLAQPPGRGLATLGRLRDAQGRIAEAIELMDEAVRAAPDDRDVLYWASSATRTRGQAVERLERYLERSEGDDPDRIVAAEGSIRVLRALGEEPVWIATQRPERLEIPLRRVWDPSTGTIQGFVVEVLLGDSRKPVRLLLDSGSPGLFVIHRIGRKRGFQPLAQRTSFGGGGKGQHQTTRGFFTSVALGELRFRAALSTTTRQELDPTGRYHGVLGLALLNGYTIKLDFAQDRLLLEPPGDPLNGPTYWTVEGQMLVRAGLNDDRSGLFLFDTGSTRTLVDMRLAERIEGARLGREATIRGFGGWFQGARSLEGVRVAFSEVESRDRLGAIDLSIRSRLAGIEIAGFLGLNLIGSSNVVIDTIGKRLVVTSAEGR